MAPVIFGLDLAEIRWGKFKSGYMWNSDYHLRRTKFIVYQLAMIFCVVSESLGTAALSDYLKQQDRVQAAAPPGAAYEFNNDFIGIASFNIFAGIYVAFIFGGAFFFDLFWPERREDRGVRIAWRCCSVAACVFVLADVIAFTIILVSRQAWVVGLPEDQIAAITGSIAGSPLDYSKNGRAIASVVFLWLGFPCVFASTVIMWFSLRHDEGKAHPFSAHKLEERKSVESAIERGDLVPMEARQPPAGVEKIERPDGVES